MRVPKINAFLYTWKDFEKEIQLQTPREHAEYTCQATQNSTKLLTVLINIEENLWVDFTENVPVEIQH